MFVLAISTHVPTRGTTTLQPIAQGIDEFQPTSPRGGRLTTWSILAARSSFQPTSPRGGRQSPTGSWCRATPISTHVPTRGTTGHLLGAALPLRNFNPRPHAGDDAHVVKPGFSVVISTHVPTRGTTAQITKNSAIIHPLIPYFQFTVPNKP